MMKPDFTINKNFKIDVEETSNAQHTQKLITAARTAIKRQWKNFVLLLSLCSARKCAVRFFITGWVLKKGLVWRA